MKTILVNAINGKKMKPIDINLNGYTHVMLGNVFYEIKHHIWDDNKFRDIVYVLKALPLIGLDDID